MENIPSPQVFCVLVNAEGQHSLWAVALPRPEGWAQIGPTGSRDLCLAFVEGNWTDMRPRRLRDAMAADAKLRQPAETEHS
jgi:MbtH protein